MRAHEFGCPLVLAASGLGVIALCQAAAQQVLEFHSGHEQGGVMWIQTAIRLVAQHEAVITVVDDEALGDAVDSVVQRFPRPARRVPWRHAIPPRRSPRA